MSSSDMLQTFKSFSADNEAWDMFVTGQAGTGKTTDLSKILEYCEQNNLQATVCAYTHKACGILESKLPQYANIQTLHSFLKKRPTINENATRHKEVTVSRKFGDAEQTAYLFIDEYSMIGERDFVDIQDIQSEDDDGNPTLKIVWIGDPNQLPPVGDVAAVSPYGKYQVRLTKIYRQAKDNPLITPLTQLVSFIEGAEPEPLVTSDRFVRDQDLVEAYKNDTEQDKVLLAFTNEAVQQLNAEIKGYAKPKQNDMLFSPTTKQTYFFTAQATAVSAITLPFGNGLLLLGSKYKTLEHLLTMDCSFAAVIDEYGETKTVAYVFGHQEHKLMLDRLKKAAAKANTDIEQKIKGVKATVWAKVNHTHPLAKARAKAWRDFLTFNECVICLDFPYAMTVHKSQGSTYKHVYVDTQDVYKCAGINFEQYLKLMYVALSRASFKVVTN